MEMDPAGGWRCTAPDCGGRGLTRRRFFFLTGLAGLFVATKPVHGLALAERPPITIPTRHMYARVTLTAEELNATLKRVYAPFVAAQINEMNGLILDMMKGGR